MYKGDLTLNNIKWLIYRKTKQNKTDLLAKDIDILIPPEIGEIAGLLRLYKDGFGFK